MCRVIERTVPTSGRGIGEAELVRVVREIARDGQRCRCENPRTARRLHLATKDIGDRQRRRLELPALRRDVDPADPIAAGTAAFGRQTALPSCDPRCGFLGTARDAREIFASLRVVLHLGGEPIERCGKLVERINETGARGNRVLRELAGQIPGGEPQLADRGTDVRCGIRKPGNVARVRARSNLGVTRQLGQLSRAGLLAEKKGCGIGKLMRLVEDHRVACGQQLREPLVAQHHVGKKQVMIDDDDIGIERVLARLQYEAFLVERTVRTQTVVARRGDERPDRCVLGHVRELCAIAALARARKRDDFSHMAAIIPRRQAVFARRALEMMMTDVIRASLEHRNRHRYPKRVAQERNVAFIELILQGLRARRHDYLAAIEQRGDQIGERLAGACSGLGD